jgi:alpha 1,3-mannosyltransferase
MTNPCKGYLWCAYDILGASTDPINRGTYIEYDNVTINTNEYLGLLWLDQDLINLSEYEGMKGEREKGDLNVIIEK